MEISYPNVSNCIIDQREPRCVLLISTSTEAAAILSDHRQVPAHCKRALTRKGDGFFLDPNYRTYGGKVGRPMFRKKRRLPVYKKRWISRKKSNIQLKKFTESLRIIFSNLRHTSCSQRRMSSRF